MNPAFIENEIISDIKFTLSQKDFEIMMNKLDHSFGGKTYYGNSIRPIYYNQYISNPFHINISLNNSEKISAMEQYIKYVLNIKSYSKYKCLTIKRIQLTDNELTYILIFIMNY